MKTLARSAGLLLLAGVVAFAQRGGFHGGFRGGGFGGFRGGGFGGFHGGFGGFRGGGFVGFRGGGFRGFVGFHRPFFRHFGFRTLIFQRPFFSYPYFPFYGGFYGGGFYDSPPYDNSYAPPAPSNVVVYAAPPAAGPEYTSYAEPSRPVIVNYNFGATPPAPPGNRIYFSLAFKDGTVTTALAYWVDGNTLHYIDSDGAQHTAPVDSVDRDRSLKLNRDRGIDFGLPR